MSKLAEILGSKYTLTEIIAALFVGIENKCDFSDAILAEVSEHYFNNNTYLAQAQKKMAGLVRKHRCPLVLGAQQMLNRAILSREAIDVLLNATEEHVNESQDSF